MLDGKLEYYVLSMHFIQSMKQILYRLILPSHVHDASIFKLTIVYDILFEK